MIYLCMDVSDGMTLLRLIPHKKRGKVEGLVPHGSLSKVKKGTDDLTPYGAISDLLACGDREFIELLFNTICNQAKSLEMGQWKLHRKVKAFGLAIIGGSTQACVVASIDGKQQIRFNNDGLTFTCQDLEERLESQKIVNAEEGEMMVYSALKATLDLAFTHQSGACIDCVIEIHSDDSDSLGGLAMQAIWNLESSCIGPCGKKFVGAIYLHGPQKSVAQVARLGDVFKTNIHVSDQECPASGRGLEMLIDLIALYYTLEQDNSLLQLPRGHRAISALTVTYTLVNHDYLAMSANSGVTYRSVIAAMKSEWYKEEACKYAIEVRSPVSLTRSAVGYNLPGIILLMHHVFINRPATKKILLKKYSHNELGNGIKFNVVRAAAVLAGEMHQVPDPVSLLTYLSCANLVFRRWAVHVYNKTIQTDHELKSSSYEISTEKGERSISINFNLCGVMPSRNALDDRSLQMKLRQSCFGTLIHTNETCNYNSMPFNPLEEVRNMISGYYPTVKVSAELLPQAIAPTDQMQVDTNATGLVLEDHEVIDYDDENNSEDSGETLQDDRNDGGEDSEDDNEY